MRKDSLAGCGVLVTRPEQQAEELVDAIKAQGGNAIRFPVIEITARKRDVVTAEFQTLPPPDILIFVSANAARFGGGLAGMTDAKIAAIGPATRSAAEEWGAKVEIMPETSFDSEHLLAHPMLADVAGKTVTIVRGERGRELLGNELSDRGASVSYLSAYRRLIRRAPREELQVLESRWRRGDINCVTVLSVDTLENLIQMLLPSSLELLRQTPLVAPGARVIQTAVERLPGVRTVEAAGLGTKDIVQALKEMRD